MRFKEVRDSFTVRFKVYPVEEFDEFFEKEYLRLKKYLDNIRLQGMQHLMVPYSLMFGPGVYRIASTPRHVVGPFIDPPRP